MKTLIALSLTAAAAISSLASGSITGTLGAATQISPPIVADVPFLMGPNVQVWDEQQNRTGLVFADLTTNAGNSAFPTPGVLTGNFDSHFIHFTGGSAGFASGTVFFSNTIAAVAWNDSNLDLTDATWGALGTTYPTGQVFRGMNTNGFLSVSGNAIHFNFNALNPAFEIEQVRVWTLVPAPGACSLAAIGGLLAFRRRRD